jgi:hypothetical protein
MPTPNLPPFYREDRAPADLANQTSELDAHRLDALPLRAALLTVNINLQKNLHKSYGLLWSRIAGPLCKGLFIDLGYGLGSIRAGNA